MSCLLVLKEPGKARLRVIASAPRLGRLHRWWTLPIYQDAPRAMRIAVAADACTAVTEEADHSSNRGQGLDDDRTAAPALWGQHGLQIARIDHLVDGFRPGAGIYCLLGSPASRDLAVLTWINSGWRRCSRPGSGCLRSWKRSRSTSTCASPSWSCPSGCRSPGSSRRHRRRSSRYPGPHRRLASKTPCHGSRNRSVLISDSVAASGAPPVPAQDAEPELHHRPRQRRHEGEHPEGPGEAPEQERTVSKAVCRSSNRRTLSCGQHEKSPPKWAPLSAVVPVG